MVHIVLWEFRLDPTDLYIIQLDLAKKLTNQQKQKAYIVTVAIIHYLYIAHLSIIILN